MRKTVFNSGEYYHIYNRGVDKRKIFGDGLGMARFFQSMEEFNTVEPIGSIYEHSFVKKHQLGSEASKFKLSVSKYDGLRGSPQKLVKFVCYCLNPNHFHFVLQQVSDRGIEKFMHRLGTGYTKYFNIRHNRSGVLFQGVFKSKHIDSNEYLLHLSAYVNLNYRVHQLGSEASKWRSSWNEYIGKGRINFCAKNIILDQFKNTEEYTKFAKDSLRSILEKRATYDSLGKLLLE